MIHRLHLLTHRPTTRLTVLATMFAAATKFAAALLFISASGALGDQGGLGDGDTTVYHVPWHEAEPGRPPAGDLVVYWFPASQAQMRSSDLRTSRNLAIWSSQCIDMVLVPHENRRLKDQFQVDEPPLAILATQDGTEIRRVGPLGGRLQARSVEEMVETELRRREDTVREDLKSAKDLTKEGDEKGDEERAAALYTAIAEQACLFPGPGKKAAKALRKMGRPVPKTAS